jgi:hypothetical protein
VRATGIAAPARVTSTVIGRERSTFRVNVRRGSRLSTIRVNSKPGATLRVFTIGGAAGLFAPIGAPRRAAWRQRQQDRKRGGQEAERWVVGFTATHPKGLHAPSHMRPPAVYLRPDGRRDFAGERAECTVAVFERIARVPFRS